MEHIVVRISSKRCHMPLDIMSIDMKVILTYVVLVLLTYYSLSLSLNTLLLGLETLIHSLVVQVSNELASSFSSMEDSSSPGQGGNSFHGSSQNKPA